MSSRIRYALGLSACLLALAFMCLPAQAYFWWGIFDGFPAPRPFRWSLAYMDTNGDGDVSGPDEGIEITYESGPFGWTDEEVEVLDEAFAVWERVPTSFVQFRFSPPIEGPLEIDEAGIDFINYVAIQDPDAPPSAFEAPLPAGVLGIALMSMAETDIDVPFDDDVFFVPGGTIVECDLLFQGFEFRPEPGEEPAADLLSVAVHEVGHLLAMGHTPLNNVGIVGNSIVENPAVSWRNFEGELVRVGVTPTMFPAYFLTQEPSGVRVGGLSDLAPDDIAGISYLYPRLDAFGNYFNIASEARTQSRPGFPSEPIAGGHIVAWADTDNNPGTPRVPLVSTMTGLYEPVFDPFTRGRFDLRGLPKSLETVGSPDPFVATYTLSINELDSKGFEDQAPPLGNTDAPIIDTTHNFNPIDSRTDYESLYPEEVFHEDGEIFNLDNVEAGTQLYWDAATQSVRSVLSDETLPELLKGQPMFGDTSENCPVLALTTGLPTQRGPDILRAFRDNVLLSTSAGAALVASYYDAAPGMVHFLNDHAWVYTFGRGLAVVTEWLLGHSIEVALMTLLTLAAWRLRRRRALAATAAAIALALALANPTSALTRYMTEAEVIQLADLIVVGTIETVESREIGDRHRIVTDIVVDIDTTLKGTANKDSDVFIRQPGGRVNGLRTFASELPQFTAGEDVVLYLEYREGFGYAVIGGARGKYEAKFDQAANDYQVAAPQAEKEIAAASAAEASKALSETNAGDGSVTLSLLKTYIDKVLQDVAAQ